MSYDLLQYNILTSFRINLRIQIFCDYVCKICSSQPVRKLYLILTQVKERILVLFANWLSVSSPESFGNFAKDLLTTLRYQKLGTQVQAFYTKRKCTYYLFR